MVITCLLAAVIAGQVPTFRAHADAVGITISAVNSQSGVPVDGLQADDFVVMEDGIPQRVVHFGQEDVPASVVLLLDASASVFQLMPQIQQAAARLIRSLRPADEVQVVQFAGRYQELNDFTTDHETAITALESGFVRDDATYLTRALYVAATSLEKRFPDDVERRRIIILLSDGENTSGSFSTSATLERIQRSGVTCYVVHIARRIISSLDSVENARIFMENVARESGGRVVSVSFYHPEELAFAYTDIARELGTQYHIGYESTATTPGWHTIGIMMRRRADVRIRYRRSYYVPLTR